MIAGWEVRQGEAAGRLREMPAGSVQCVITSPPYYGLRDYGTGEWSGGDAECDHVRTELRTYKAAPGEGTSRPAPIQFSELCGKCGARRTDEQLGLEATPAEYVERLVDVLREARRVLRADGTLWLNLGDSYASNNQSRSSLSAHDDRLPARGGVRRPVTPAGIKPKDLLGIPWLVAFALRDDGWFLRSDIIWAKPNPMPESVTDRPTSAHEHVFLFAKSAVYYYDADAIAEPHSREWWRETVGAPYMTPQDGRNDGGKLQGINKMAGRFANLRGGGRNKRNVWEIASEPYDEAHFATFPPRLVEPMVRAGCPYGGTVLDPFAGSGTTLAVAVANGRHGLGIELNPSYVELARRRLAGVTAPLFDPTPAAI